MPTYILTYARTIILKRRIEAKDQDDAMRQAIELENDGELGLATVKVKDEGGTEQWLWDVKAGSEIDDIQDEENIWEIGEGIV